jgi:hypothetical protein
MATKKTAAKKKAAAPVVKTTEELLALFQKDAEKHLDILKRVRTRLAPGAAILLSHGETDK